MGTQGGCRLGPRPNPGGLGPWANPRWLGFRSEFGPKRFGGLGPCSDPRELGDGLGPLSDRRGLGSCPNPRLLGFGSWPDPRGLGIGACPNPGGLGVGSGGDPRELGDGSMSGSKGVGSISRPKLVGVWVLRCPDLRGLGLSVSGPKRVGGSIHVWTQKSWGLNPSVIRSKGFRSFRIWS